MLQSVLHRRHAQLYATVLSTKGLAKGQEQTVPMPLAVDKCQLTMQGCARSQRCADMCMRRTAVKLPCGGMSKCETGTGRGGRSCADLKAVHQDVCDRGGAWGKKNKRAGWESNVLPESRRVSPVVVHIMRWVGKAEQT